MTIDITPDCRYGHGNLILINEGRDLPHKWGYLSGHNDMVIFTGNLYVCPKCGYTELFDDDVDTTVERNRGKQ
ncbi:MAG: hypothetical protein WAW73_20210 [Rhodoferax sp.]